MKQNKKETIQEEELKKQVSEELADSKTQTEANEAQADENDAPLTETEILEKRVEELTVEIDDYKDKYLRLSAEFDNYRKRTMKEKAELILNGGEKCIVSLLPVIDDLERAVKTTEISEDIAAIKEGIDLIYNKFISILSHQGVKIIETQEKPLDTDYHEAIAVIPAPAEDLKGIILDTVQTGYTLNDKVIRHSKVVVGE